jgi:hypothetical protein
LIIFAVYKCLNRSFVKEFDEVGWECFVGMGLQVVEYLVKLQLRGITN